eukprot:15307467-Alexandrium_andersonii.AAC.1
MPNIPALDTASLLEVRSLNCAAPGKASRLNPEVLDGSSCSPLSLQMPSLPTKWTGGRARDRGCPGGGAP